jgi:glycosyltransferase involved in cell wall biosynthesis
MSEHEGFGVPLVESMLMGVPVLAYRAGAVPGTLGRAGVLFDEKEFDEVAEMAARLAAPGPLRTAVLAAQKGRLAHFAPAAVQAALKSYVDSL